MRNATSGPLTFGPALGADIAASASTLRAAASVAHALRNRGARVPADRRRHAPCFGRLAGLRVVPSSPHS